MRYISLHDTLVLSSDDGIARYRFGPRGVLIVGDPTTHTGAANEIDVTPGTSNLQQVYTTTLDGNTDHTLELCGLGSLTGYDYGAAALATLVTGYRGTFFESPIMTGTDTVTDVAGVYYQVLTGTVTYNGTAYTVGEQFVTASSVTATTGTGTFALAIPPALKSACLMFLDCEFEIKHLQAGDEPYDYVLWNEDGSYTPRDSMTCSEDDYIGWMR